MLTTIELLRFSKAIEFLYAGMDITKIPTTQYRLVPVNGELVEPASTTFCFGFDSEVKELLKQQLDYIYREGALISRVSDKYIADNKITPALTVTKDILFNTLRTLKQAGIEEYKDVDETIFNPKLLEELEEIRKTWDYTKTYNCDIKNKLKISDTDLEFKALVTLADYPNELPERMYNAYKTPRKFILKSFKDFEVSDNRIIIPLSGYDKHNIKQYLKGKDISGEHIENLLKMNAIVISKNPLDYFYCSYGNAFQSCYALNSTYKGWYGYMPFSIADESFIIYGTTGGIVKTGIISGSKFHQPQMFWRAWGYADEDGNLLVDKKYRQKNLQNDSLIEACCKFLTDTFGVICDRHSSDTRALWNEGSGLAEIWETYDLNFYSDSLCLDEGIVEFCYSAGDRGSCHGHVPNWQKSFEHFIKYTSTVNSISKSLDITKPCEVIDGVLLNPKHCPITNLIIPIEQETHYFAKYLKEPVKHCAVLTYVNGTVFTDASTYKGNNPDNDRVRIVVCTDANKYSREFAGGKLYTANYFSSSCFGSVSIKTLKEHIKGNIKDSGFDAIILRIIEDDKLTVQVFKKGK
jgi:hypothetical protein